MQGCDNSPNGLSLLGDRLLCSVRSPPRTSGPLALPFALLARSRRQSICTPLHLIYRSSTLLPSVFGHLIIILIKSLSRLLQLALHAQQLLYTTQFIRVTAQSKAKVIDLDLLAAGVVRDLRGTVAQFEDEVCDDLVQDADSLRERLSGIGWMWAGVAIGKQK